MLEKRQKSKTPPQQLDFVDSISQVDRLFTKRRLIGLILALSVFSSVLFMLYGQYLKGKRPARLTIPKFNFSLPSGDFRPKFVLPPLPIPASVSYIIKIQNLGSTPPSWIYFSPPSSLNFDFPPDLASKLSPPPPSSGLLARLPTGLSVSHYLESSAQSMAYFIDLSSPRHHFLIAFKFFAPASELKSLELLLPEFVETIYWELVGQKIVGVGVPPTHFIRLS